MKTKIVIFSAPSGAGKTTIVQKILQKGINLEFSISACSRSPRGLEVHGVDYYFITTEEFRKKIEENAFIEWEQVYENSFYGSLKSEIERIGAKGNHVLFDVDVKGAMSIKKQYGNLALTVFVMPPSLEVLEQRLRNRATDSEASISKRIAKAKEELKAAPDFDVIILNDNLDQAVEKAWNEVNNFLNNNS